MSTGKLVEEGKMIHGFCIKTSFVSELNVCNSLITMYAKLDSMHDSRRIFEELNYREIISWNALISGHGDYESVMNWFKEMEKEGVRPDSITFLSLLAACGRTGMVNTGCQLFESMVKDHHIEPFTEH
ncbi:hypothetical protein LWI28_004569 [Acer negundo]|uniref:Pentatricopeptide repeat-containing protein n=1 Tax=Acer negundo TaxID=4023 RepID=A0AAD5J8C7_ACENE|nr:hypothetical protein LWI28_004569 [Acer negundo]